MSDQIRFSAFGLWFLIFSVNTTEVNDGMPDWLRLVGILASILLLALGARAGRKAEHEEVMRRGSSVVR